MEKANTAKRTITTSVREIVEYTYAYGDLVPAQLTMARAQAGTRGHREVQQDRPPYYKAEVSLKHQIETKNHIFIIQGRADGIYYFSPKEDTIQSSSADQELDTTVGINEVIIDEIKTTTRDLEELQADDRPLHWYQAQMYGHIVACQEKLEKITIQLTYYHLEEQTIKEFRKEFTKTELENFFQETAAPYLSFCENIHQWEETRDQSISSLCFPYEIQRKGQQELIEKVTQAISHKHRLFACAPTGIGKTVGVLYPAIKTLGQGLTSKLFFLTARTTGRAIAEKTIADMREAGLKLRAITLTAKEKICAHPEASCHPESCPCSSGYFDRLKDGLTDGLTHQALTRQTIEELAQKHQLCPFEYSLDLALFSDTIICDYNYAFDPRVRLRRFFDGRRNKFTILVDEAHNLVNRGRDMFSAEIVKGPIVSLKRTLGKKHALTPLLQKMNKWFIEKGKTLKAEGLRCHKQRDKPEDFLQALIDFRQEAEITLVNERHMAYRDELLDLYFQCANFEKTAERFGDDYVTLTEGSSSRMRLRLFNTDPSRHLRATMDKGKSTILFSATLRPLQYYRALLTGSDDDETLTLSSPFPPENLCALLSDRIATTYRKRHLSYEHIARTLVSFTQGQKGNYLVFFPSYAYMHEVYGRYTSLLPLQRTLCQESRMSEEAREQFLAQFEERPDQSLVAFAVMGGIFGEGIDLVGEKCVGTAIIGVGLPQICLERDVIREHFDEMREAGFAYAYQYPGMTRVLQAAGRLIRTQEDRGVLLLIDERFGWENTRRLLPPEWPSLKAVRTPQAVSDAVKEFWQ